MAKYELKVERELKFGIEIEMIPTETIKHRDVADALTNAGINCGYEGYTHKVLKRKWKVVTDGSIRTEYGRGIEVVSPVLEGEKGLAELEKVVKVLNELGCKVNKDCGLHVHHDINDFNVENIKNVYRLYYKHMMVFDEMMPKSRRGNTNRWCGDIEKRILDNVEECTTMERLIRDMTDNEPRGRKRYRKINLCSYLTYGTVEFRQHNGTVNFEKMRNWVLLTHKVLDRAKQDKVVKQKSEKRIEKCLTGVQHSGYDLYCELGINGTELSQYVGKRRAELKKKEEGVA